MPPQLTEAWSIAYLQILIVLLIFAFGIPSIIFQVTLPEEMQHIVNRYMKKYFLFPFITVVVILFFSLSFIWCLHPCDIDSACKDWTSAVIVSLSLIFLIVFWWIYLKNLSKKNIVNYLGKKIYKRFKKGGSILTDEMENLITLGERSEAGHEKYLVLDALSRLIKNIQTSERYSGGDLEDILRSFEKIVTSKNKPGNEANFLLSIRILEDIVEIISFKKLANSSDERAVCETIKEIGKSSVKLKLSKHVILKAIEIASPNSGALFEIGLSAFKSDDYDYFEAQAALNKLESLALAGAEVEPNTINDLFGLLAHFWAGNQSSRRCAQESLNFYGDSFLPLDTYLNQAIEDHYSVSRFDTADRLMKMRDDLKQLEEEAYYYR
ncbi:MAG: hypothetical protein KAW12_24470 [Candidatus Aminicenantes bacterium]|nr:hypothetical protein [Candidatus Aminicenantes bacterium]